MSKSCFNMLSDGIPLPHNDQLVTVMLDRLLRLLRFARSRSMQPIHIYAELLRYPMVVKIQVTLKYAVCTIAASIDVHALGPWNNLEQHLKEVVGKELEDKLGTVPLVVNRLMLMAGDCSLLGPEKASYQESLLHAARITHSDGAIKQIAQIGDIRLIWEESDCDSNS
ncbi:hypothetical protein BDD12DRAFT_844194 [Trichophaea hybrida]|nr:hypothetical protein BDD12DRAFT_844194 [Trichophaea hybrida]